MPNFLDVSNAGGFYVRADYPGFNERFSLDYLLELTNALRNGDRLISEKDVLPEVLVLKRKRAALPDTFVTANGMFVCSEPFRKAVEELDPELHQFFPLKITFLNGDVFPNGSFFILNVVTKKKTVDVTKPSIHTLSDGISYSLDYGDSPIYFSKEALEGAHMWREEGFSDQLSMSDFLLERLKQERLKVFKPRNSGGVV